MSAQGTGSRGDGSRTGADAADGLRAQDEILQVLFWMRGEELGEVVRPEDLEVFLTPREDRDLTPAFRRLAEKGLVEEAEEAGGPAFRLTEEGLLEGGRRFADEFADIAGQAHASCNDPDCACQSDPAAAAECHEERHGEHAPS